MLLDRKAPKSFQSPVMVVDALGFTRKILDCDETRLGALADSMDKNYLRFRKAIPFGFVIHTKNKVWGTSEFSTFRLNDMFVVFSRVPTVDPAIRFLITTSIAFQALLLDGFIPRGGLGWGLVHVRAESLIGAGFVDAYAAAEKRSNETRDICAVQLSRKFMSQVPPTAHALRLVCFYRGEFFVNPIALTDPALGQFDRQRVLDLLTTAGIDERKLAGTRAFLEGFEDFDAAAAPDSLSRRWRAALKSELDS